MNNATAEARIKTTLNKLEAAVGEPVFDEWVLARKTSTRWQIIVYEGPRQEAFINDFKKDMAALRETLDPAAAPVGDFAFSHEGFGSGFDAYICAGEGLFILLNNTGKSTGEITSNPKWRPAQVHFSDLVESFIVDPIV